MILIIFHISKEIELHPTFKAVWFMPFGLIKNGTTGCTVSLEEMQNAVHNCTSAVLLPEKEKNLEPESNQPVAPTTLNNITRT